MNVKAEIYAKMWEIVNNAANQLAALEQENKHILSNDVDVGRVASIYYKVIDAQHAASNAECKAVLEKKSIEAGRTYHGYYKCLKTYELKNGVKRGVFVPVDGTGAEIGPRQTRTIERRYYDMVLQTEIAFLESEAGLITIHANEGA